MVFHTATLYNNAQGHQLNGVSGKLLCPLVVVSSLLDTMTNKHDVHSAQNKPLRWRRRRSKKITAHTNKEEEKNIIRKLGKKQHDKRITHYQSHLYFSAFALWMNHINGFKCVRLEWSQNHIYSMSNLPFFCEFVYVFIKYTNEWIKWITFFFSINSIFFLNLLLYICKSTFSILFLVQ